MKNCWILYNSKTGEVAGRGNGELDLSTLGDLVVRYRDDHAAIKAEPAILLGHEKERAEHTVNTINKIDRTEAKARKAATARRFLAEMPRPDVVDASDPDAIPAEYMELFDEYWNTFDVPTPWSDQWEFAELIVEKATAAEAVAPQNDSLNEAMTRREKVIAENTLLKPRLPIPDD